MLLIEITNWLDDRGQLVAHSRELPRQGSFNLCSDGLNARASAQNKRQDNFEAGAAAWVGFEVDLAAQ